MKRAAVFFDRDNTLIACDGYLGDPSQVTLVAGAADAVARARAMGFAVVVVSNQSGVARGMFDEAAVEAVNARLDAMLAAENAAAVIDRHEYCPYHPEASIERYRHESERRKPKPGMILEAARALALDLSRSWLIGDARRDIEAGKAAGVRTILFTDPSLPKSTAAASNENAKPEFTAASLPDAMAIIATHQPPPTGEMPAPAKLTIPTEPAPLSVIDLKPLLHAADQILREIRLLRESPHIDFSVTKLFAGIVQVLALAAAFFAYLYRDQPTVGPILLSAIFLQTLTISLAVMGRK